MIAVITPWYHNLHLLPAWHEATEGAYRIVVDTAPNGTPGLHRHVDLVIPFVTTPFSYAAACNAGLDALPSCITHAVCLNNDISGSSDWLRDVARIPDGVMAGPEVGMETTAGQPMIYLAGWCVAATVATWKALGGWDAVTYVGSYHEDVDLSWRAARAKVALRRRPWALRHFGNTTSRQIEGTYANHAANRAAFLNRVLDYKEGR